MLPLICQQNAFHPWLDRQIVGNVKYQLIWSHDNRVTEETLKALVRHGFGVSNHLSCSLTGLINIAAQAIEKSMTQQINWYVCCSNAVHDKRTCIDLCAKNKRLKHFLHYFSIYLFTLKHLVQVVLFHKCTFCFAYLHT